MSCVFQSAHMSHVSLLASKNQEQQNSSDDGLLHPYIVRFPIARSSSGCLGCLHQKLGNAKKFKIIPVMHSIASLKLHE